MSLVYQYRQLRMKTAALTLGGRPIRPKAVVDVSVVGPTNSRVMQGLLDTGADDTVFPEGLAPMLGIDLTGAPEIEVAGVGPTGVARLRLAQVTLRLATNVEQREWSALVGFTASPLRFSLLGFAGCLQYFTATFYGDREEVELTVNSLYAGI